MASAPSRRRILRLHLGLVLATAICASAFVIEVLRALGGNTLSWAYVFEWPILLAYGVYMWQRLVREERAAARAAPAPAGPATPSLARDDADDEARAAWNAYLAERHAEDAAAGRARRPPATDGHPG